MFSSISLYSGIEIYQVDNGEIAGYSTTDDWEEACLLKPEAPCMLHSVKIYLKGGEACKDTIWIAQDPTDGNQPPTIWVMHYAAYSRRIFDYTGEGWYEFVVSDAEIKIGGHTRLAILHHCGKGRPGLAYDTEPNGSGGYKNISNYITDVYTPNPNFYNIAGTLMYAAKGHYLCRLMVEYLEDPDNKPSPTMLDVTTNAGLIKTADSTPLKNPMGSVADWNNDGFDDIATAGQFMQNNGDGTFTNVSASIGVKGNYTVWGDIDNDGFIDCFVNGGGLNDLIFYNNGDGTFSKGTNTELQMDHPNVTPLLFDYNRDGYLDIFMACGRRTIAGSEVYFPDQLFKNNGDRTFENVTASAGIEAGEQPAMDCWGASVCDFNSDGWIDVYVNTYRLARDLLYKNNGDGTFSEIGKASGAAGMPTSDPNYFGHGMGSDWGDYDNDGDYDVIVGNLGHPDSRGLVSNPSLVLRNDGFDTEKFTNVTNDARMLFFEMNGGVLFADLNNDSYLDIVHALYSYHQKTSGDVAENHTRFYQNAGPDKDFRMIEKTWEWGADIHGAWVALRTDYDNDGDMDIYVCSGKDNNKLFENQLPESGNWSTIRLVGDIASGMNSLAYGAEVIVSIDDKNYVRSLPGSISNGRTSQSTNAIHFGIGDQSKIDRIMVLWNNQANDVTEIQNPPVNMILKIGKNGLLDMPNKSLISVDKSIIDFGVVNSGEYKEETITITNIGDVEMNISSISIIGTEGDAFAILNETLPTTLAVDQGVGITIGFAPTEKFDYRATLKIESDAGNSTLGNIVIIGKGYEPSGEIAYFGEPIDFGNVLIGESKSIDIELSNIGEAVLEISHTTYPASFAGCFSTPDYLVPVTIAPGETEIIPLAFAPSEEKTYSGNITIHSDAFTEPEFDIFVTGIGEAKKSYIAVGSDEVVFPETNFGETSERDLLITNSGNKDLIISEINFQMDRDSAYKVKDIVYPFAIAPESEETITITFTPIKESVKKTMRIYSDATDFPTKNVKMVGVGVDPNIVIDNDNISEIVLAPNPVNEMAKLEITIADKLIQEIKLSIMDINGKCLKEIDTGILTAGQYSVDLDFGNISAGTYYISDVKNGIYIPIIIE
ncbi:MAG: hypothetical protein B7C24_12190 [Bacteroidetes bacterium 4572_77]|nr:MAG: hypothetical protein B7C24_12190 [Bacteroidetes bacterium 4572_77]